MGHIGVWLVLMISQQVLTASPEELAPAGEIMTCRDRSGYWDNTTFHHLTCASCYGYLFQTEKELRPAGPRLISVTGRVFPNLSAVIPDVHNTTLHSQICRTLQSDECYRWTMCCLNAQDCCETMHTEQKNQSDRGAEPYCPRTWDGYGCWPSTPPSQDRSSTCPSYIPHAGRGGLAYKSCDENGTWYRDPASNMEWSDYTECVETHLQDFQVKMYVGVSCSVASIVVLIPAMAIFLAYRQLRCQHRIQLHLHMFASFILSAFIHIIWQMVVVHDKMNATTSNTMMHRNTVGCKLIYILTRYSRTSNYMWMFCEAFYLHKLIAHAFEPPSSLIMFYVLGWGFPWLPVILYSIVKVVMEDEGCWIKNLGAWEWLIYLPNLLALVMNLLFLINILRILLTQLQSHPNEPNNYRRAFKATALLVPLFGLQWFFIIYRPVYGSQSATHYEAIATFVITSQGFFVALIFCFLNSEVHGQLRRTCCTGKSGGVLSGCACYGLGGRRRGARESSMARHSRDNCMSVNSTTQMSDVPFNPTVVASSQSDREPSPSSQLQLKGLNGGGSSASSSSAALVPQQNRNKTYIPMTTLGGKGKSNGKADYC